MKTIKARQSEAFKLLKDKFGYTNALQVPKITKVVISSGIGSMKDKKKVELVADVLFDHI